MSAHLTNQQLNAYLHQTLNDAQRETLDVHLSGCPACRARLSELSVLQRRLRRELAAELKAVNVPLSLTFVNATARNHRAANTAWLWQRSTRVLAGMMILAVIALAAAGALFIARQTATTSTPISPPSQVVTTSGDVGGWNVWVSNAENYEVGLDYEIKHSGQASGYIRAKAGNPGDSGFLSQQVKPDSHLGKRLRLSAYIKTSQAEGRAGLWMRIDGPQGIASIDNMVNRPIHGTTDWQKYDVVLDVPADSTNIAFGVVVIGNGQVWIDDVQFEEVGLDVATTAVTAEMMASEATPEPTLESRPSPADSAALIQPANLSFETGTAGWSLVGDTQSYTSGVDSTVAFDGQNSSVLAWDVAQPIGLAKLVQSIKADVYHGQRLRITAWVKSDSISEWKARLFADVYAAGDQPLLGDSRPMRGATWQKYEMVFDVPDNATRIEYGISLEGQGRAWLDDVQVEVVGKDVSTTTILGAVSSAVVLPKGVDLDGEMSSWNVGGSRPQDYAIGFDATVAHSGQSSAHIKSVTPVPASEFGSLNTDVMADNYQGKRVRFSAYVKANHVNTWAGLWMSMVGPAGKLLGYDNMQDRSIRGTSDWQKYEVVLDVPENSVYISYGVLVVGQGEVWFDDVQFETVGDDVPVTDLYHQEPLNLNFENVK